MSNKKKSDFSVGTRVSFQARHGEVIGSVAEVIDSSVVITSDLDHSHRYRIPLAYALTPKTFKLLKS